MSFQNFIRKLVWHWYLIIYLSLCVSLSAYWSICRSLGPDWNISTAGLVLLTFCTDVRRTNTSVCRNRCWIYEEDVKFPATESEVFEVHDALPAAHFHTWGATKEPDDLMWRALRSQNNPARTLYKHLHPRPFLSPVPDLCVFLSGTSAKCSRYAWFPRLVPLPLGWPRRMPLTSISQMLPFVAGLGLFAWMYEATSRHWPH